MTPINKPTVGGFIRCSPAGYERAIRAFELEFPGITVSLTSDFSNVLNAKIEEQLRTKKVDTDLVILQTIQDLLAWNRRGQLLAFKPDGFDTIDARLKDRDGGWVAVNNNPIFYGYNKEQIRLIDVPRLATDFFNRHSREKLITTYPVDNDATLFAFSIIVQKYVGLHDPIYETAAQIHSESFRRRSKPRVG